MVTTGREVHLLGLLNDRGTICVAYDDNSHGNVTRPTQIYFKLNFVSFKDILLTVDESCWVVFTDHMNHLVVPSANIQVGL